MATEARMSIDAYDDAGKHSTMTRRPSPDACGSTHERRTARLLNETTTTSTCFMNRA